MSEPARIRSVPSASEKRLAAEEFGRRMREFAELLSLPAVDAARFGELMGDLAGDFAAGEVVEAIFYDSIREATDLLPLTRKQSLHFAARIYRHLQKAMNDGEHDEH